MAESKYTPLASDSDCDSEHIDLEKEAAASETSSEDASSKDGQKTFTWMCLNTVATVGIVFTNKLIFSSKGLRQCQLAFAAFHFFVTAVTLHVLSRPSFGAFTVKRTSISTLIPLTIAMCLNVILPNFSLAFSSVTFYQIARILLTPTVAVMNYMLYRQSIPVPAALVLIPTCLGVGMVSYYDTQGSPNVQSTSSTGVMLALAGVVASSLYTVWISSYQKRLEMSSMQLLYNQAPIGSLLLLYIVPWSDQVSTLATSTVSTWLAILMSGAFAAMINISQFHIIGSAGPVTSTVVGHVKTCIIVALGWIWSGREIGDKSIFGVLLALAGIISYAVVMLRSKKQ